MFLITLSIMMRLFFYLMTKGELLVDGELLCYYTADTADLGDQSDRKRDWGFLQIIAEWMCITSSLLSITSNSNQMNRTLLFAPGTSSYAVRTAESQVVYASDNNSRDVSTPSEPVKRFA